MTAHSRFNKMAAAIYDRLAESGRFAIGDVQAEIRGELASETTNAELLDEVAVLLAQRIDNKRVERSEAQQLDLLTGEPAALDAVLRLGHGQRVTARVAKRADLVRWLGLRGENFDRVKAAYDFDRQVVAELLIYMPDDETTVELAVERRKAARRPKD